MKPKPLLRSLFLMQPAGNDLLERTEAAASGSGERAGGQGGETRTRTPRGAVRLERGRGLVVPTYSQR